MRPCPQLRVTFSEPNLTYTSRPSHPFPTNPSNEKRGSWGLLVVMTTNACPTPDPNTKSCLWPMYFNYIEDIYVNTDRIPVSCLYSHCTLCSFCSLCVYILHWYQREAAHYRAIHAIYFRIPKLYGYVHMCICIKHMRLPFVQYRSFRFYH